MPKRTDIDSILIIGAGPIVIGQACEFDYSGAQACKALREEGYRVILVNSNPATIMTDPDTADATYIEPITADFVRRVIEKERPDAVLPTMGGQTALNVGLELAENGTLEEFSVEMIGAKPEVIEKAEDRDKFRAAMEKLGLDMPKSAIAHTMEEAEAAIKEIGLPAVIRPSFTLGGKGGGIAFNQEEFEKIASNGLKLSPTSQVLIDESILGWKEYEMEVVRDSADNCIIVCSIENVDPMGVHTGDSITVAPALTLTDKEYQIMRDASLAVLREIGVDTGGSNVQFAVNPESGRLIVIEMNPRVSRSSALASKATGFPIAKVAAKLAVGYTLDELENDITGNIPASFEPTIDYVVTKIPRFTFEKFPKTEPLLGTSMKSVGEAMSIGRNFQESFQKAIRSLEIGLNGLEEVTIPNVTDGDQKGAIRAALSRPTPGRISVIAQAFRYGMDLEDIQRITKFDPWFLSQIQDMMQAEHDIRTHGLPTDAFDMLSLKQRGFGDARLAQLAEKTEEEVRAHRENLNVKAVYKRIDSCAAEFKSPTPYLYSTYEIEQAGLPSCEAEVSDRKKVIILGGGPNRIGQGIEFDYCCVHAAFGLQDIDIEAIIINCNPETVSTDYDTADRLYFEPLTVENVLSIVQKEQEKGEVMGVIVQFGGQTPLKIAAQLEAAGVPILGTSVDAIDLAEDRERFQQLVKDLNLLQPDNDIAFSAEEAIEKVDAIGFPVVVRPSYVLGGRGMEIVYNHEALRRYVTEACVVSPDEPVLIDKFLHGAIEIDVDAICDGDDVFISGIMEHIEEAGVHSGDSSCALPPHSLSTETIAELERQTKALARALKVRGLMNIQFAVQGEKIYLIEVNPRASRTVPFVAKATNVPVAKIAAKVMAGKKLKEFDLSQDFCGNMAIKSPVFPFDRFITDDDNVLGPEMRSTGEVMGVGESFGGAFARAQIAASNGLPKQGTIFVSVKDQDKPNIVEPVQKMLDLGYRVVATYGNAKYLNEQGVGVGQINKVQDGQPHIVDAMINGQVQLVLNTTEEGQAVEDSAVMRRAAVMNRIPYFTTLSAIEAAVEGMSKIRDESWNVTRLQK